MMTRMTGGRAVLATLQANGAHLAFGIPGAHNLAIYDAMVDRPRFRHVVARNEQGASLMANAAGRARGEPGICIVTTGPAACNALVGVADAACESVPMLVISSQIASHLVGQNKGAFHEVRDQKGMFQAAGAWTARPNRVEQIPATINAAWVAMTHGRPGPAYVEICEDVLNSEGDVRILPAAAAPRPGATPAQIQAIVSRLSSARRPLVYAGGGAVRASAGQQLRGFVERLNLPVVTTVHGKGVLPEDHALCFGAVPMQHRECRRLFETADLVLALGTGFGEVSTGGWNTRYPAELIQIDIDGSQIGRNVAVSQGVVADVQTLLSQLNVATEEVSASFQEWTARVMALRSALEEAVHGMAGAQISRTMRALLPRDAIIVGDAAEWGGWQIHHFPVYGEAQMLYPLHFGTLGYSIPGAIGAQAARPGRRVVAVCGDGGFLFCSQELATAVQHRLPVIVVLVNNRSFGGIRHLQERRYGAGREIASELQNPDFAAYARSFGCFGRQVVAMDHFAEALAEALASGVPAVIEIAFPVDLAPSG